MFYSGEFLRAFFLEHEGVTVDNNYDSRKYYEYGTNMIMFTHGDKEKPAEMPLIMATEQPTMFARTTHREVHCGHMKQRERDKLIYGIEKGDMKDIYKLIYKRK